MAINLVVSRKANRTTSSPPCVSCWGSSKCSTEKSLDERRRDGVLVLPVRVNIAEVFLAHLDSPHCKKEVKQVVTIEQRKVVRLLSKGTCHFQFAMKQRIDLKEDPLGAGREIMID
ncbi:hypothetical protein OESDEN_02488 [Oesophagostomum dentatum]|uniref:Uncharacterized protein n=1 Tax=Oesophagostomum dentatum TaxID=61180 RepID=A0A0B1TN55_OESDE|nr:hypothetical protein OESDEN_02488 [Oesophagostomum dentatum]